MSTLAPLTERTRILLVDDEPHILRTFRYCLEDAGYRVATVSDAMQAEQIVQNDVFDICFLDLSLGESSGLELLPKFKQLAPWMKVVIVTAHSSVDSAVDAMRAGANDYLVKPCSPDQLRLAATKQAQARQLELRLQSLENESGESKSIELDTHSALMRQALEVARQVADTDANVLLLGESGTGKGMLARAIHNWSPRAKQQFITINCPSLSTELLESELFGHKKGSFTGAIENKLGRVDQADGGTLFLDEIGDFPLALQPKLLRFIQDREYERVGDPITRRADVRIVAATNRNLAERVQQGHFREDLLYRLNVITIELPSLRDRPEDVAALAERFLGRYVTSYRRPARGFTAAALGMLRGYGWPGNVRELQNVIERAAILCTDAQVDTRHLAISQLEDRQMRPRIGDSLSLEEMERSHIIGVIASAASLDAAAHTLGIDVSTLYRKRKHYGI